MAQSNNNVITHGLSGKVGGMVIFSQRHGKTVVGRISPRKDANSEKQQEIRKTFKQAVVYAKAAIANADLKCTGLIRLSRRARRWLAARSQLLLLTLVAI
jgi:hypothetical protein